MIDNTKPTSGSRRPSAKHAHGRIWLAKRSRHGLSWAHRKAFSTTYCLTRQKKEAP